MSQTGKILVVDDEGINRITMEAILAPEGYQLHFAANGREACETARAIEPDLVLLDVMMPDLDGFEVCRRLRADPRLGSVPVIMVTALNDAASRLQGINAGADDFLSKPYALDELRARVRGVTRLNRFRVIAEQRTRFERLFAITPAAIVTVTPQGDITAANDLARELLRKLDAAPADDRSLFAGLPADVADRLRGIIENSSGGSPLTTPPELTIRVDGLVRHFTVNSARLDENGDPRVMLILNDVTTERRARDELLALNQRLDTLVQERTARLESANELLLSYTAFVSHDLRSPLSVMRSYLSLIETGGVPVPPQALNLIKEAAVAADMMQDMIANILAMASDEHHATLPAVAIDPRPVIERLAWKICAYLPKPRPQINVGPLPRIRAGAPLVERVFYNLISNAVKYAAKDRESVIEIGATPTATGTAIHVRDNGVGFDAAHAEKLFKSFSRLPGSEETDGLGLGLSLVSRLIGAHQGRIWAEGRPGEGATFFVEFVTADDNATPASAS